MRRTLVLAVSLACLATAAQEANEPTTTASASPPAPMFAAFASGHAYTLTNTGPWRAEGWKRLGVGVGFLAPSSDWKKVRAAAYELVTLVDAEAVANGDGNILLVAYTSYDPAATASRNTGYNYVFERKAGKWETAPGPGSLPAVADATRQAMEGWGGFHRDAALEPAATRAALEWLQLMANGKVADAFARTTNFSGAAWTEGKLQEYWDHEFRPRGPVRSRAAAWWLHRWNPEEKVQPPREYLLVSFRTKVGKE